MIYLKLLWTFFKIGLFSFGGGYAMIPLIQKEIELNGWIHAREFADIVAISQMTPGPIAVNAATYVGVKTAGVIGSAFATLGVSLPSLILTVAVAKFFTMFKNSHSVEAVLKGVRPVTMGLISSAVVFFAQMSIFTFDISLDKIKLFLAGKFADLFSGSSVSTGGIIIFILILIGAKKFKMHPILAVVVSAVLGILLM